ncbi:MAG: hypothetical protein KDA24_16820 [Deltaproteobacteria bacterium]|nr:hypothetical protein [Deltaproteobacteria bacterium]
MGLAYRIFAVLWTVAVTYDFAVRTMTRDTEPLLVTCAAVLVLLRPSSTIRLVALSLAQLWFALDQAPGRTMVHWYFNALVHLSIVGAWLHLAVKQRTLAVDGGALYEAFRGPAMLIALTALTLAGFSKLNSSYLDPSSSCATVLWLIQVEYLPWLPSQGVFRQFPIWGSIVCELLGPGLLAFRRTRPAGIALLGGFFFFIGINPVNWLYEFAGPTLLCSLLVVGEPAWTSAWRWLSGSPVGTLVRAAGPFRKPLVLTLLLALAWLAVMGDLAEHRLLRRQLARVSWVVGEPLLVGSLLLAVLRQPWFERARLGALLGAGPRWLLAVFALFLASESLPYVGIKHTTTFTMAGNTRFEDGFRNHLVLPEVPDLYWNRGVQVVNSSNDRYLQKQARRRTVMNFLTLASHLHRKPDSQATIRLRGEVETIGRAGDDPRFAEPPPLWRWLKYPPSSTTPEVGCSHRRTLDKIRKKKAKRRNAG